MAKAGGAPFTLTLDLNVLEHLADGLYSSVAAVLTEAVANSWDADAEKVHLDLKRDRILICDDGIGMTKDDINEKYLRVGYRRRDKEGALTPEKKRKVMGRKGIGKLSLFSIAGMIRVETRSEKAGAVALVIDVDELRTHIKKGHESYHPTQVDPQYQDLMSRRGTVIELSRLRQDRLKETCPETLRRRLARRFSVVGSRDFRVWVNGTEVTANDRDDLKFAQYLWIFDGTTVEEKVAKGLAKVFAMPARANGWPEAWRIQGWIATVDRPKQLATSEGNLNSIVVLSRGRLVDEDILPRITNAELYTKYVAGQIEADFLDDEGEDIVTSDRQRVREEDPRVQKLVAFLRERMAEIGGRWSELRVAQKGNELLERYPKLQEWLEKLPKGVRGKARSLLGRVSSLEIAAEHGGESARRELLRHAIFGFQRLVLRGDAEELENALASGGVDALLKLLADRDALEAAHYRDIVTNRLEVVRKFEKLVDEDDKEKVLQEYLFDHLWLLDPSWDRAAGNEAMEQRIRLIDEFRDDEETKEKYGRVDIRYRDVAGRHMIVELKRRSARPTAGELFDQVRKYRGALAKVFPNDRVEGVIVLGANVDGADEALRQTGYRVATYDELIVRARQAYSEYLERTKDIDFIEKLLT